MMSRKKFSNYDIVITLLSLISFGLDTVTDVALIVNFFSNGHPIWAACSLAFVALAMFVMQIFSFCWHVSDGTMSCSTFVVHALFLAPVQRFWRVLKLGIKSRKSKSSEDLKAAYSANNDVCLLRLFESFLESAPQLVLQLYIIIAYKKIDWIIGVSAFFSLTSVAWAVSAYTDGLRLAYHDNYNRRTLTLFSQTLWQMLMLSGRVLAVVVFASHFKAWIFLGMGLHWIMMTCWITLQNADFGDSPCEKRAFNAVSGFIYLFVFLNLKDGSSRGRLLVYYIIMLTENSLLILLWFVYKQDTSPLWLDIVTPSVVFGGFFLGAVLMFFYYGCCHPSGPKPKKENESRSTWFRRLSNMRTKERRSVFDAQNSSFRVVSEWLNSSVNLSDRQNNSVQLSLSSAIPDIVPVDNSQRQTNDVSLSTYQRAPSIGSSLYESDGNITVESGQVSYTSGSSRRQLISSSSSRTPKYRVTAEINQTFSPDTNLIVEDAQNISGKSLQNAVQRKNAQNSNPSSGNSSYEFAHKKVSMSPLDPSKLWELSQERIKMGNSASRKLKDYGFKGSDEQIENCRTPARRGSSVYCIDGDGIEPQTLHLSQSDSRNEVTTSSGGQSNSSKRSGHCNSTFSDSQYNSNSDYSKERLQADYSFDDFSSTEREPRYSLSRNSAELNKSDTEDREHRLDSAETSQLSNFFADVSSLHVPNSNRHHYLSSVSEIVDGNEPLTNSFPWANDHDVFYDEGEISDVIYKQKIRNSLQGKSYYFCNLSDATQLDGNQHTLIPSKRQRELSSLGNLMEKSDDNDSSVPNTTRRSSSEKCTDDSGYQVSGEMENPVSYYPGKNRSGESFESSVKSSYISSDGLDLMNASDAERNNKNVVIKSVLPGLSYLMSDSDVSATGNSSLFSRNSVTDTAPNFDSVSFTVEDASPQESFNELTEVSSVYQGKDKTSPLQVKSVETSPLYKFGRNVDLYNSSINQTQDLDIRSPKSLKTKPPPGSRFPKIEKLKVMDLNESPYKFRSKQSAADIRKPDVIDVPELVESPYKFRSTSSYSGGGQMKTKFYTMPEHGNQHRQISSMEQQSREKRISDSEKENRKDRTGVSLSKDLISSLGRNKKNFWKNVTDDNVTRRRPKRKTRVDALKNKCYSYSDTDSDGEIASNFSSRSQYGSSNSNDSNCVFGFSPYKPKFPVKPGTGAQRSVLRSLENTPGFSPIVSPNNMDKNKVFNASGPIMKPVVSTPTLKSSYEELGSLSITDEPSTIAV